MKRYPVDVEQKCSELISIHFGYCFGDDTFLDRINVDDKIMY